jgi:hypothetical protein
MCGPSGRRQSSGTGSDAHSTRPHGFHVTVPVRSVRNDTVDVPLHAAASRQSATTSAYRGTARRDISQTLG